MSGKEFYTICNEFIICRETLRLKKELKIGDCSIRCINGCLTLGQNLCLDGNQITDLAEPINPSDAVTKQYVDTQIGHENLWDRDGITLCPHYPTDRMWLNEIIEFGGSPSTPEASIAWDGNQLILPDSIKINNCVIKCVSGHLEMTQDLNMDGNQITNLAEPINLSDAVTKNYVDNNDQWEYTTPCVASLKDTSCAIWLNNTIYMGGAPATPEFKFMWDSTNNTVTVDNHVFLPDDIEMKFGNTTASPDAYIKWDSANNRLQIDADQIYYYHTWFPLTSHTYQYNRYYFYSNSGNNAGTNIGRYDHVTLAGSNDFTGLNYGTYVYVCTWSSGDVGHIYGNYTKVHQLNGNVNWMWGGLFEAVAGSSDAASNCNYAIGGDFRASSSGLQSIIILGAGRFSPTCNGSGNVNTMYGVDITLYLKKTGNVTHGYDILIHNLYKSGSGTLTYHYGIRIEALSGATYNYPLYIDDQNNTSILGGNYKLFDYRYLYFNNAEDAYIRWNGGDSCLTIGSSCIYLYGCVKLEDGTEASPILTFYNATNNGIFRPEADVLAFSKHVQIMDDNRIYFGDDKDFEINYDSINNLSVFKGYTSGIKFYFYNSVYLEETLIFKGQSSTPSNADNNTLKIWLSDGTPDNEYNGNLLFRQTFGGASYKGEINKLFILHRSIGASGGSKSITLGTLANGESADVEVQVIGRYRSNGHCNIYDLWAAAYYNGENEGIAGNTKHSLTVGGTTSDLTFSWSISSGTMALTITNNNASTTIDVKVKWSINRLVSQA